MTLLSAITGVILAGSDNNIFTQIGLIVLVGLACKNAILIVEFAKDKQEEGMDRVAAVLEACRLRLRPILMTSIAFIMGVVPLVISTGAGAEMRHAMGVAVFSGMIGVTFFGLLLTPVFYVLIRRFVENREAPRRQRQRPARGACMIHAQSIRSGSRPPWVCSVCWRSAPARWVRTTGPRHRGGEDRRHGEQALRPQPLRKPVVETVRRSDPEPVGRTVAERQPRPARGLRPPARRPRPARRRGQRSLPGGHQPRQRRHRQGPATGSDRGPGQQRALRPWPG